MELGSLELVDPLSKAKEEKLRKDI